MARLALLVIPGIAYHVTQRGNRRQTTFFEDEDFALYRDLIAEAARRAGSQIWSYCLMPNHVHLIVVPADDRGCAAPWPTRTAATPASSMRAIAGPGICGREGSARW